MALRSFAKWWLGVQAGRLGRRTLDPEFEGPCVSPAPSRGPAVGSRAGGFQPPLGGQPTGQEAHAKAHG